MLNSKRIYSLKTLRFFITLIFFAVSLSILTAQADESIITSNLEGLKKIKQQEKENIKQESLDYVGIYKKSAKLVASQGGNPKPLLDAAAYFANKAKK